MVVEANAEERALIKNALIQEKFHVMAVGSADEMREVMKEHVPDIVLLAILLPDANGLMLMQEIHEKSNAQVIVVTLKNTLTDKIIGLELGADDYITKPFETRELVARVNARMRRQKQIKSYLHRIEDLERHTNKNNDPMKIKFGDWILDRAQWQAYDENGKSAELTPREFHILETFVLEGNKVLTRSQLLDKAWRDGNNTTDRAVDVQILRIRRKIGDTADDASIIKAVRGVGYQFIPKTEYLQ